MHSSERNECKDRFFRLTFDTRVNKRAVSKQSSANDLCHLCRNGHRSVTRHEPSDANATLYDVFLHRLNILRAKERRQDDGIGHRRRSRPLDNPKLFLGRILDLPTSSRLSPRQLFATARRRVQDNFSGNYARMDERCPRDYVRPRHPLPPPLFLFARPVGRKLGRLSRSGPISSLLEQFLSISRRLPICIRRGS